MFKVAFKHHCQIGQEPLNNLNDQKSSTNAHNTRITTIFCLPTVCIRFCERFLNSAVMLGTIQYKNTDP